MKAILFAMALAILTAAAIAQTALPGGTANFRPLVDSSITVADVAMDDQGAITVYTRTNIYRWNNGALTELFPNSPISLSLTGAMAQILHGTPFSDGPV